MQRLKHLIKQLLQFAEKDMDVNDVLLVPGGTAISRRHCLIVNSKADVWLYDLGSTGTYLNDVRITSKTPIIGLNKLTVNNIEYTINTDEKNKLL